MPSPEIINAVPSVAAPSLEEPIVKAAQPKQLSLQNFIRSFVLLTAVYALIINRAIEDKKNVLPVQPPVPEQNVDYSKAYVHISKKDKQNALPLMFYTSMTIAFYPTSILWK